MPTYLSCPEQVTRPSLMSVGQKEQSLHWEEVCTEGEKIFLQILQFSPNDFLFGRVIPHLSSKLFLS